MTNWMNQMFDRNVFGYVLLYGSALLATFVVAQLSYTYLEKPFLLMKGRFTVVRSQPERSA